MAKRVYVRCTHYCRGGLDRIWDLERFSSYGIDVQFWFELHEHMVDDCVRVEFRADGIWVPGLVDYSLWLPNSRLTRERAERLLKERPWVTLVIDRPA